MSLPKHMLRTPAPGSFGELLHDMRRGRDESKVRLGRRAGFSDSLISRIESGDKPNPRRSTVEAICDALDLAPGERAELLAAAGYVPSGMAGETEALRLLAFLASPGVSDEGKSFVRSWIRENVK